MTEYFVGDYVRSRSMKGECSEFMGNIVKVCPSYYVVRRSDNTMWARFADDLTLIRRPDTRDDSVKLRTT